MANNSSKSLSSPGTNKIITIKQSFPLAPIRSPLWYWTYFPSVVVTYSHINGDKHTQKINQWTCGDIWW